MRKSTTIMIITLITVFGAAPGPARLANVGDGSRAEMADQVLDRARAALGGEAKLKAIRSLSAYGKLRRVMKNVDQSGKVKLEMLLPDKFRMTTTLSVAQGVDITMVAALDGDQASKSSMPNSPGAIIVTAKDRGKEDKAADLKEVRATFVRYMLAWLLTAPPSNPVEFNYAGEAEAGDDHADVLDVKGSDGLEARLFFDKKTHSLLMMSYWVERAGAPADDLSAKASVRDVDKALREAKSQTRKEKTEIQVYFSDYRLADGIYFPHHLLRTINAQPIEEWELEGFKVNADLNAEKFLKK